MPRPVVDVGSPAYKARRWEGLVKRALMWVTVMSAGCEASAPEPEWIAFSSGRTGDGDVYAIEATGGPPRLLLGTPAAEGTLRYDPFADRLVHSRFDSAAVWLMDGAQELFPDPNGDVAPVWSTSGRIAFVVEAEGVVDVFVAARDGRERERVTSDDLIERYPAWHPDGRQLVYAKRLESGWDLHSLDVDEGLESRLTYDGTYVGHPSWSPTGDRIAFDRMYDGQTEIVVLDVASGDISRLTNNEENDLLPSWSAEGAIIAFAGARGDNWDIWTVTVPEGVVERLTTDTAFDGGPVFVPVSVVRRAGPE